MMLLLAQNGQATRAAEGSQVQASTKTATALSVLLMPH